MYFLHQRISTSICFAFTLQNKFPVLLCIYSLPLLSSFLVAFPVFPILKQWGFTSGYSQIILFFPLFTVTLGKNSWWPFEQYLVSHECRICQVLLAFPGFLILCTYGRSTSKWFKKTISKCSCMTCVLYVTYYIILKLWASASLLRRSAVPFFW